MSRRAQARILLISLALVPIAAAETLPSPDVSGIPTVPSTPSVPSPPSTTGVLPGDVLDINQNGFVYQGTVADPTLIRIEAPDGTTVLDYHLDNAGHATLAVEGTNAIADATLVAIEGSPTGDAFTLHLLDATGQPQDVNIDRAGLMSGAPAAPPITITRPPDWPGAPRAPYLIAIDDSFVGHLAPEELAGASYLNLHKDQFAIVQIPVSDPQFDRIFATVAIQGKDGAEEATFTQMSSTDDAATFAGAFTPESLGAADGDIVSVQPIYEHRVDPLVVERFPEATNYTYKLDGAAPTISFHAPASASDFRVPLTWSGSDATSGIGGYTIEYRLAGQTLWTPWMEKTTQTSGMFSGEWNRTYEMRAIAMDKVGNTATSPIATMTIGTKPAGASEDDINHAPTARLLTPAAGSVVGGISKITWDASDPDGTPVTSKLEVSSDNGATWRLLYSGPLTHADWNTRSYADGAGYRLRLTVSDGTLQASDATSAITVRNVIAPAPSTAPSAPTPTAPTAPSAVPGAPLGSQPGAAPTTQASATPTPAADGGKKGVRAPQGALLIGAGLLAALIVAQRRRA